MNRLTRPAALKIAAVITVVLSLINIIVYLIPDLLRGQATVDLSAADGSGPLFFVVLIQFAVAMILLVAAYGTWHGQRWGVILTIVLTALSIIPAILGSLFSSSAPTRFFGPVFVILLILTIVLCLWRERKPHDRVAQTS